MIFCVELIGAPGAVLKLIGAPGAVLKRTRRAFFLATRPFVTVLSLLLSLSFSFLAFSSLTSLRRGEAARACLSRLLRIFFAGEVMSFSSCPVKSTTAR